MHSEGIVRGWRCSEEHKALGLFGSTSLTNNSFINIQDPCS